MCQCFSSDPLEINSDKLEAVVCIGVAGSLKTIMSVE